MNYSGELFVNTENFVILKQKVGFKGGGRGPHFFVTLEELYDVLTQPHVGDFQYYTLEKEPGRKSININKMSEEMFLKLFSSKFPVVNNNGNCSNFSESITKKYGAPFNVAKP